MIPLSTDFSLVSKNAIPSQVEAAVVFSFEGQPAKATLAPAEQEAIDRLAAGGVVRGKAREIAFDVVPMPGGKFRRLFSVGLGKAEKLSGEVLRQAAGQLVRALRRHRLATAAIVLPSSAKMPPGEVAEAIATGALLAAFEYEEYKGAGQKRQDETPIRRLEWTIVSPASEAAEVKPALERAQAVADGQNFARTIASRPGNDINPPTLAKAAQQMAREVGLGFRVLDEKELGKLGMGGILAVGAGSVASPPRLIVLEYRPAAAAATKGTKRKTQPAGPTLLVVGKSITFDTGGISIKPAEKMGKMIYDKCGGMAVLGLMYALAKLKLPVHVVGILSSAENAVGSAAYRPGDILRMYNGVTVDVTNTDAEGRLVLADALAWGIETYKPAAVVDLATLTGGVVTALGKTMAGVMSNNDQLVQDLTAAGEAAGEKMWRLPLGEDQRDQIRAEHADIVNSAGREAHPLQGGAFLSYFVPTDGSVPWAHLDIAGVADTEKDLPYYAKGPTGWGVRTLVNWVQAKVNGMKAR